MSDLIKMVREANPGRNHENISRRTMKLMEEVGEACQAYLSVTSPTNGKGKTWDDVREELADSVIVALDIALTPMPDEVNKSDAEIEADFLRMVEKKLKKWRKNRKKAITAQQDAEPATGPLTDAEKALGPFQKLQRVAAGDNRFVQDTLDRFGRFARGQRDDDAV